VQTDAHDGIEEWSDLAGTIIFKGTISGQGPGESHVGLRFKYLPERAEDKSMN
jgi:hypothetical protein